MLILHSLQVVTEHRTELEMKAFGGFGGLTIPTELNDLSVTSLCLNIN